MGKKKTYNVTEKSPIKYDRHYDSERSLEESHEELIVWCCCRIPGSKKKSTVSPQEETYTKTSDISLQEELERIKSELTICKQEKEDISSSLQEKLERVRTELTICKREKEDLSSRFSELAGRQLSENNPNITNLNDPNRPQKLAEMFSEIYDNEWTDAYITLRKDENTVDRTNVCLLLELLKIVYDGSFNYISTFTNHVQGWFGEHKKCPDSRVSDFVVSTAETMMPCLTTEINKTIVKTYDEQILTTCSPYIERCITACFYMAVKSPQMILQFDCVPDKIDKACFKPFTTDGDALDYLVWPALFLYKDGPLMSKGVVQLVCSD